MGDYGFFLIFGFVCFNFNALYIFFCSIFGRVILRKTKQSFREYLWLKNKLSYECKHCHSRQLLRSETVMEHNKLPFRYRFIAMHLLTSTCGAGSQNKSKVMVMTESAVVENPKPPRRVNHIKIQIVPDLKADTATKVVKEQLSY